MKLVKESPPDQERPPAPAHLLINLINCELKVCVAWQFISSNVTVIKFRDNLKSIQYNLHILRSQNHLDHDCEVVLIEEGEKVSCEMASERSSM